ncbi:MAG: HAMP domain-containing sensor histidine kinase [Coriobacteriales bacterium]|nr:HAMP domain-containing sensor histidine kinase [Coriobacteriales bacterium]
MQRPATKLAALAIAAVFVVMVAATVAFNLFTGWKVTADATGDLQYALSLSDDAQTTGRTPNYVMLDAAYQIVESDSRLNSPGEKKLAAWFAKNPQEYRIERVVAEDLICYAVLCPYVDYYFDEDQPDYEEEPGNRGPLPTYFIGYIDTSAETALARSVTFAFAVIGVLGAVVAGAMAHMAGVRIERSQEAQKRFYENMSHELKTPLAAIRGYAEGVRGGVLEVDSATTAIVRETTKMTDSIDEILGLSRLEAGVVVLHREDVEVADFVQDCLMPFEGVVRSRGLAVELDLAQGSVQADHDMLQHAVSNILGNACRHASGTLRVTYDGKALVVYNDCTPPDASQLDHLFDRFYVGEGGSTGIGLAIAYEIATLHGFSLCARAEEDGLSMVLAF